MCGHGSVNNITIKGKKELVIGILRWSTTLFRQEKGNISKVDHH